MLKAASFAGLAAASLVSAAASNTTTTTSANTGANPLIPTSASSGCQNTLAAINGDAALAACTQPLLKLIQAVDPSAGGAVPSDVVSILNSTCSQQQQLECDDSHVRSLLGTLASNCSAELAAQDPVVLANYDVLYMMTPFRQAVCSVDSKTGSFCISELAAGTAPSSGGSVSSSSSAANATGTVPAPTGGASSVVSNATNNAAETFSIATYAGAALTPANLYVQFTNQDASSMLGKRQSGDVALPSGAPSCASTCWSSKISEASQYGLDPTSASSLCSNSDWTNSYKTCTSQNCDSSDVSSANSALTTICSGASSSSSSSSNSTTTSSSSSNSTATSQTASAPNAKTFALSNLPYLFLSSNMTSAYVCTQCTKTVLLRYLQWESQIPYDQGIAASPLLGTQTTLWSGLTASCGSGFTSSIEAGTSAGDVGGAASTRAVSGAAALMAAIISSVALL